MTPVLHPDLRNGFWVAVLSIFTSSSTLLCCALPALLVAVGAGAALAGIVTALPQLIWLSAHKVLVFLAAGLMLGVVGVMQQRARYVVCPRDATLRQACEKLRRASTAAYGLSVIFYFVGGLFAFVLPQLSE